MGEKKSGKYHFEEEYAKTKGAYWSLKPGERLIYFESLLKRNSKVLDLGCGTGRVALYLASKGHSVTAMDISETAITKLNGYAKDENLEINTIVADMDDYVVDEEYDVIVALFSIHFLSEENVNRLIENMKEKTVKGGFNFVGVFRKGEGNRNKYRFKDKELSERYFNWDVIKYDEYSKEEKHGKKGKLHTHKISNMIAQKII